MWDSRLGCLVEESGQRSSSGSETYVGTLSPSAVVCEAFGRLRW